jgi:alpha-tubulin suppressor-like RCC1 family protein/pimeloyl-ACP methyl ester carboxylesterase
MGSAGLLFKILLVARRGWLVIVVLLFIMGFSHGPSKRVVLATEAGTAWAWGDNDLGKLGMSIAPDSCKTGTSNCSKSPAQVTGLTDVSFVSAGQNHSLALKSDGTVWAWGDNRLGTLGDGTTTSRSAPIQVLGGASGTPFLSGIIAVGAGERHSVAVRSDGTVWTWGFNDVGQLGHTSNDNCTGTPNDNRCSKAPAQVVGGESGTAYLTGIVRIGAGEFHNVALKSDGTVWAWGKNFYGTLGDGTQNNSKNAPVQVKASGSAILASVIAVAAGESHSLALKSDGTVWAWGDNTVILGIGTPPDSCHFAGQMDCSLTASQVLGPAGTTLLNSVTSIAAGHGHSLALKSDGTVWAWGHGNYGQLGNSGVADSNRPVQVLGPAGTTFLDSIIEISTGGYHNLALRSDRTAWSWGNNEFGQLGDGTVSNQAVPVQVKGPSGSGFLGGITKMAGGRYHSLAVLASPSITGTLTARSFKDVNKNGRQDTGEASLAGWTMTLYQGNACRGAALRSVTTDAGGNVAFSSQPVGIYSVKETLQTGWEQTTKLCQDVTLGTGQTVTVAFGNVTQQAPPPPPTPTNEDRKVIFIQGIDSQSGNVDSSSGQPDCSKVGFIKDGKNRVQWMVDYLGGTSSVKSLVPSLDSPDDFFYFSYAGFYCRYPNGSSDYHKPIYVPNHTCDGVAAAADKLQLMVADLLSLYPTAKFDVLAHSMGGLVAAYWLWAHPEMQPRVNAVTTFDSPLRGVPNKRPLVINPVCDTSSDLSWNDLWCQDYSHIPDKCASITVPIISALADKVPFFTIDATQKDILFIEAVPGDRTTLLSSPSQLHCQFDDDHSSVWERASTDGDPVKCWLRVVTATEPSLYRIDRPSSNVKATFLACAVTQPLKPDRCLVRLRRGDF